LFVRTCAKLFSRVIDTSVCLSVCLSQYASVRPSVTVVSFAYRRQNLLIRFRQRAAKSRHSSEKRYECDLDRMHADVRRRNNVLSVCDENVHPHFTLLWLLQS